MDSIKLIYEWKNNPEFKVLYDIIKQAKDKFLMLP